jgi:mannosyltransferase
MGIGMTARRPLLQEASSSKCKLQDADILVVNLHPRFAGVSATIHALVPRQQESRKVAVLDRGSLGLACTVGFNDLLAHGWSPTPSGRPRIWHARRAGDLLVGLLLGKVLRQPWKFVYTSPSPRRHGLVWRAIVNQADAIIAVTPQAARHLDRHDAVVGHGVDTASFRPPADKQDAWAETGLPGKHGIGVFGRIRRSKGTHLFVEAMCRILPERPDFCAVIAGACMPSDSDYRRGLERRIEEVGLHDRIVFLGDLAPAEIKQWYQRVALCIAPSYSEGFGLTPLEAMASGAAAVTSHAGAFPTMIEPGSNGALFKTGDLEELCAVVRELTSAPLELLAMGRRARELVVRAHSIELEVAGIHALYDRITA